MKKLSIKFYPGLCLGFFFEECSIIQTHRFLNMPKNKNHTFILIFFSLFAASFLMIPRETLFAATAATTGTGLQYKLLEQFPGITITDGSNLPKYITAVYNLALVVIVLCAVFMLSVGGFMYLTSAGNTSAMSTAKDVIFDSLIGLVIALVAWVLLNTINPDLVNVTINGLSATPIASVVSPGSPLQPPSASCADPIALKTSLTSGGKVCDGVCKKGKCNFNLVPNIDNFISDAIQASGGGIDPKLIKSIICQESNGVSNARSFDGGCGLMQITNASTATACSSAILDPAENIRQGVALYKQKLNSVSGLSYGNGITPQQMTFAAYNCCANGTNPNSQSVSCSVTDGWPVLPKWACPIDPGAGAFNMCADKNYACDVEACANQY